MAGRLEGKVCIVTGGTSGIGRACVEAFVREGAKVVFCGRREARGQEIVEELTAKGGDVWFVKADLQNPDECRNVVRECVEHYGTVDVLMNNAGFGTITPLTEYDLEKDYEAVMNLNLRAYFILCQEAIKVMVKNNKGNIINLSSIGGITAMPMQASYAASKGGVTQLTRTIAMEYAKNGIRANTISPGLTITELVPAGSEAEKMLGALVPSHTSGTAEGVANCAVFCASDETPFMTGAEITIDGGVALGACMGYAYVA
ncbi:MAG: SDR family oxidoreductase [Erysipelotrichaceae bacterium]|nr:SDR family oxidoreductase [Erysipelotrichaceae bacterium]